MQHTFYYTIPLAGIAIICFVLNFASSVWYLSSRREGADLLALVTAEVGLIFCTVILIMGSVGTHLQLGVWWNWNASLGASLVAWFLYVSYLVLRRYAIGGQAPVLAAVLAIFVFLDLPMVYMSISRLHGAHSAGNILVSPDFRPISHGAVIWHSVGVTAGALFLIQACYRAEKRSRDIQEMKTRSTSIETG